MSQPTDMTSSSNTSGGQSEQAESPSFTLHIVSPSAEVTSPLSFPQLPATTSVKELKAKIRDALPSKPADDGQRLIHRGRMLAREAETMLEIFGQETIASSDAQTLHLVLRPTVVENTAATATAATTPAAPTNGIQPPVLPGPIPPHLLPRPQSTPAHAIHGLHQTLHQGMHAQQPLPGAPNAFVATPHQLVHQVEHMQNMMGQRLQLLQRETQRLHHEMNALEQRTRASLNTGAPMQGPQTNMVPNPPSAVPAMFQAPGQVPPIGIPNMQSFINQQQRARAAEGLQGVSGLQNNGGGFPFGPPGSLSGRASPSLHRPDHTTTYTREGVGPNGERWQMTVNESTTTVPLTQPQAANQVYQPGQHTNPVAELQALLRNADRFGRNNMPRSASNPPMQRTASGISAPTITRPGTPGSIATPATTTSSPSASLLLNSTPDGPVSNINLQASNAAGSQAPNDPMVYILSSSSGPRALLVSNIDTFYTPRQSRRHQSQTPGADRGQPIGFPEFRNRQAQRVARRNRRVNEAAVQPPLAAPHVNPGAGAIAAQMGPLLWLVIRLVGFVWFFTSGNQSWTRWLMVSGLAFVVFIINTGVMNGVAEQVLGPVRRHLENLIPLAGPDAALVPAANAVARNQPDNGAPNGNAAPRRGEPDPAEFAARLMAERRRADVGWLMTQIRRVEHAALLFLASLVPGVGERHIAAREAEANAAEAERQRQVDAAAAAAAVDNVDGAEGANANDRNVTEDGQEHGARDDDVAPQEAAV